MTRRAAILIFWLSHFKTTHADGALLSAGGVTAFYPTQLALHQRDVSIKIPANAKVTGVQLLLSEKKPEYSLKDGNVILSVLQIFDHEIIAPDLSQAGINQGKNNF